MGLRMTSVLLLVSNSVCRLGLHRGVDFGPVGDLEGPSWHVVSTLVFLSRPSRGLSYMYQLLLKVCLKVEIAVVISY